MTIVLRENPTILRSEDFTDNGNTQNLTNWDVANSVTVIYTDDDGGYWVKISNGPATKPTEKKNTSEWLYISDMVSPSMVIEQDQPGGNEGNP